MHGVDMHLNLSHAAGPHTSVEYVGRALDDAGRVVLARMATRAFVDNSELELDQDRDVPMIDGAVSPHEGLTQTQETQVFEDTQVMEETEEGEIDMDLEGRVTQVVEGVSVGQQEDWSLVDEAKTR
jgi:hypothetical protein